MNKNFAVYKTGTGQIVQAGTCQEEVLDLLVKGTDESLITDDVFVYTFSHRIVAGVPELRPDITTVATWDTLTVLANGVAKVTLGPGLPNPSVIEVGVPSDLGLAPVPAQTVTDGSFTFATTLPGAYMVAVKAFPYMDYEVTINAT